MGHFSAYAWKYKETVQKKKKDKGKLQKVVNYYIFSYIMLLQFDSHKKWNCVIDQHQMIKSHINVH